MNSPIQGTAADIIKLAMINVYKELKAAHPDSKLILQVHDELIIDASSAEEKAIKEFKANSNFNLFINRGKEFQQSGRIHSQEESIKIDDKIKNLLEKYDIYFGTYYHSTMDVVVDNIIKNYNNINKEEMQNFKGRKENEISNDIELDINDDYF